MAPGVAVLIIVDDNISLRVDSDIVYKTSCLSLTTNVGFTIRLVVGFLQRNRVNTAVEK